MFQICACFRVLFDWFCCRNMFFVFLDVYEGNLIRG
jgi:hypothetical protein